MNERSNERKITFTIFYDMRYQILNTFEYFFLPFLHHNITLAKSN